MGDALGVEVHGVAKLVAGTRTLERRIAARAPRAFDGPAHRAANQARARIPHRTGNLAAHVRTGTSKEGAWVGYSDGAPYAGWIDFGGRRRGGRGAVAARAYIAGGRYLFPAATNGVESQLVDAGERMAQTQIEGVAW